MSHSKWQRDGKGMAKEFKMTLKMTFAMSFMVSLQVAVGLGAAAATARMQLSGLSVVLCSPLLTLPIRHIFNRRPNPVSKSIKSIFNLTALSCIIALYCTHVILIHLICSILFRFGSFGSLASCPSCPGERRRHLVRPWLSARQRPG